jgi:hypothetical protein
MGTCAPPQPSGVEASLHLSSARALSNLPATHPLVFTHSDRPTRAASPSSSCPTTGPPTSSASWTRHRQSPMTTTLSSTRPTTARRRAAPRRRRRPTGGCPRLAAGGSAPRQSSRCFSRRSGRGRGGASSSALSGTIWSSALSLGAAVSRTDQSHVWTPDCPSLRCTGSGGLQRISPLLAKSGYGSVGCLRSLSCVCAGCILYTNALAQLTRTCILNRLSICTSAQGTATCTAAAGTSAPRPSRS